VQLAVAAPAAAAVLAARRTAATRPPTAANAVRRPNRPMCGRFIRLNIYLPLVRR
jgi:hypothetical protein